MLYHIKFLIKHVKYLDKLIFVYLLKVLLQHLLFADNEAFVNN